jgi:hypothetical protein
VRRLLPLLLLLGACLEYEITVVTSVDADGKARRTLTIRCKGSSTMDGEADPETWTRFKPPGDPYAMEGDEAKGFVATALLRPGRHPSGLRVLLEDVEGEYGGAERVKDLPCAEGSVGVTATDLLFGKLVRYEEHVALGMDPARFRRELPQWLDTGLRLLVEALRIRFPEVDFGAVEERARKEMLREVERAIAGVYHGASLMIVNLRDLESSTQGEALERELWALAARELAPLGFVDGEPTDDGDELQRRAEAFLAKLLDRFLAPLPEAQRAEVKEAILDTDALDDVLEEAGQKLFPGEQAQEKLKRDLQAFAASAVGAYATYGLFDSFDVRVRVEMPGTVLRTNGDLSRLPAVEWRLTKDDFLFLVPPMLHAYGFVPAEGLPKGPWELPALLEIGKLLQGLEPEARRSLEEAVRKSITSGWLETPLLEGDLADLYGKMRAAVPAAK